MMLHACRSITDKQTNAGLNILCELKRVMTNGYISPSFFQTLMIALAIHVGMVQYVKMARTSIRVTVLQVTRVTTARQVREIM